MQPNQGGLLGGMQAPQQPAGGLLGAMSAGAPQQAPQGGGGGLQMAQQLAQNPTPQMAQQIIAQLKQMGSPEVEQLEQVLAQTGGDPAKIKQVAEFVIQRMSAQ